MKVRDHNVMAVIESRGEVPVEQLTEAMHHSVREAQIEGRDPETDPAVVLLAGFVAFRFHADTIPYDKFSELIEICQERLSEMPVLQ